MDGGTHRRLRVLSYNIQSGVDTNRYRQYVTQSWKHLLPHKERLLNLNRIAAMIGEYDLVGLQEVDSGSLRSGFVDQTDSVDQFDFVDWVVLCRCCDYTSCVVFVDGVACSGERAWGLFFEEE